MTIATYKKMTLLITAILVVSGIGCNKFVEVGPPIDSITTVAAYATDAKAGSVVRGMYVSMLKSVNQAFGGAVSAGLGVSADELAVTSATSAYREFYENRINAANSAVNNYYWKPLYNTIFIANAILENVPKSTGMSEPAKTRFMAEARFVRAAVYFYLTNIYGEVPLITGTDYAENSRQPRVAVDRVNELIMDDLQAAKAGLDATYPDAVRIRANVHAVNALLARVYLYRQDWENAERLATEVIEGGASLYRLETALDNVFLLSSKEVILQLSHPGTNLYTWEGYAFVQKAVPAYPLTDTLYNAFAAGDTRKTSWVKTTPVTSGGVTSTYYSPYKYKVNANVSGGTRTESLAFLRLAEMYLVRAEARAQRSNLPQAIADLDLIRKRAGLLTPTDPATGKDALLALIAHERFVELFAELGHRWLDLKRTGKADEVLAGKPNWRPEAKLFPIPQEERELNPALTQNQGYN